MKNLAKIGLAVLGTAGLAYVIYKRAVQVHKAIEEREKEVTKIKEQTGFEEVDSDDSPETGDCTINLPKDLIAECNRSSEIPSDSIKLSNIFAPGNSNIVRIRQSFDRNTKRNILSLMFQVPNSALKNKTYGTINVGDLIRAIKGKYSHAEDRMVSDDYFVNYITKALDQQQNPVIGTFLNGYVYFSWEEEGHREVRLSMIPKETYENLGYDRITDYVQDLRKQDVKIACRNEEGKVFTADIIEAFVVLEVKILMQDRFNLDGINKKSALTILEKIYNDLEIEPTHSNGCYFRYNNFLFYDIDDPRGVDVFYIDEESSEVCTTEAMS